MTIKTVRISGKTSDLCSVSFCDEKGKEVGERHGYVPDWMPGQHYGDYIELDIDVDTGKILNWKKPSQTALVKSMGE